ncbi:Beta-lactamase-like protein [Penicillium capsulatum]|uniref:Beta-lactamase-like protein n=1 Tax=Penicillium capsulatum TaxID=69766 RepID=A0A9W9LLH1_9EURO|nr:Beta-lactamase-like protein [Penicillium capsulatum]KAJ6116931.1 Beta-lactamase-like protein [Penicillium capsulatum]
MSSIISSVLLFSVASSAMGFRPCPLLGPAYPPFTLNIDEPEVAQTLKWLTGNFTELVDTNTGPNGDVKATTSFSIALFSSDKGNTDEEPFFWQFHHTSPELKKTSKDAIVVNKDSIYGIGGLTEVFTIWSLLINGDDQIFDEPVTKYLPELNTTDLKSKAKKDPTSVAAWEDITVGQLASHLSGLARDYCVKDLSLSKSAEKAGLPKSTTKQDCCDKTSKCTTADLLKHLATRPPVAPAGMTPGYSNLAFQVLGYIVEKGTGKSFEETLQSTILDKLGMKQTSVYAPKDTSAGVIPVSEEASGWSAHSLVEKSSRSMFSSTKDLSIAGQAILKSTLLTHAQTRRWLKPLSHTSNPKNSIGAPWVIYSDGKYPNTSMVDVYTVLSNEDHDDGLYSSYLGLVPDYGVGYAILSADTVSPADLNAHADYVEPVQEAIVKLSLKQALNNYGGKYEAANSSIVINGDKYPGLYIDGFTSNGVNFRETLAELLGIKKEKNLSIRLYPTQRIDKSGDGSKQAFRAVLQDKTELADADTPTCVSWLDVDKFQYNGHGLDELIFTLDKKGKAVEVEIPSLEVTLKKSSK